MTTQNTSTNTGNSSAAPVITTVTNTKVNIEALYQTLVTGILANLADVTTFPIGGGSYSREELIARFQEGIAAAEKTKASKNQWHLDVQSERQAQAAVRALRKAMQRYLQGRYGSDSAKLGEFGFAPSKPRKTSAKTKATAAVKAKATRVARNTVGKVQRKAVKAAPPASPPVASPPPASPPTAPSSATAPATGAHPTSGGAA